MWQWQYVAPGNLCGKDKSANLSNLRERRKLNRTTYSIEGREGVEKNHPLKRRDGQTYLY
jgi:hypothetical protein